MFHERKNDIKLIFLIDAYNYKKVDRIINYVEKNIPWIDTLRIGLMRNEEDYWNDKLPGIISFKSYRKIIQKIINNYKGRLSFEILTKGVLIFNDHSHQPCSVDRFRNVFPNNRFSDCVIGSSKQKTIKKGGIFLPSHKTCVHTRKKHCLIYKTRLSLKSNNIAKK